MSEMIKGERVADVWLKGVKYLQGCANNDDYTVVLEIANPCLFLVEDHLLFGKVDNFLQVHGKNPLHTVTNTIFPSGLYKRFKRKGLYSNYLAIYPTLKRCKNNKWGTYFYRMINRVDEKGKTSNPLDYLIEKLSTNRAINGPKRSCYELGLVDPFLDIPIADPTLPGITYHLGGPCLSHLSFKIIDKNKLGLTVFYRSHYYLQRALGNLIGLAQLMEFVAKESGLSVGQLVCISSYAVADTAGAHRNKIQELLQECEAALSTTLPVASSVKVVNFTNAA